MSGSNEIALGLSVTFHSVLRPLRDTDEYDTADVSLQQ